jgi:hypothetical protein
LCWRDCCRARPRRSDPRPAAIWSVCPDGSSPSMTRNTTAVTFHAFFCEWNANFSETARA